MSIQLQLEQMPDYLAARFIGAGAPGEASQQYESIAEFCERTKNNKLLIDTTRLDVKLTVISRILAAQRLSIFATHRIKVAFICRQEHHDPENFAMLVARNRGVTVEAFTDFQDAEKWLLE